MKYNFEFNFVRFGRLAFRDLLLVKRRLIVTLCAFGAVLTVIGVFLVYLLGYTPGFYPYPLIIVGAIYASRSFEQVNQKARNDDYLMIPATISEKVMSKILFVQILLPVALFIIAFLAHFLAGLVFLLAKTGVLDPVDLLIPLNWSLGDIASGMRKMVFFNSIFMLGSIWFRNHQLFKSLLSTGIFFLFMFLLIILIAGIYKVQVDSLIFPLVEMVRMLYSGPLFWVFIPYSWVVIWFRLRETESKSAV